MATKTRISDELKIYPLSYNPIIEYWKRIEEGEEVVGDKIKRLYKKLVDDIHDTEGRWMYSSKHGNHPIEFIESFCRHSKGKWAGQKIELELWQKAGIAAAFGFVDRIDKKRQISGSVMGGRQEEWQVHTGFRYCALFNGRRW